MPNSRRASGGLVRPVILGRLVLAAAASAALAGCSADSLRFADGPAPQPAPYRGAPEVTGSLGPAPSGRVDVAAAPPPAGNYGTPSSFAAPGPVSAGGAMPSYAAAPPAPPPVPATPRVAATPAAPAPQAAAGTHVVQSGETLNSVARMYNVQPAQLAAANNIGIGMTVRTGQQLVIPQGGGTLKLPPVTTTATAAKPAPTPKVAAAPAPGLVAAAPMPSTFTPAAAPAPKAVAAPAPAAASSKVAGAPAPASSKVASAPASAKNEKVETAAKVTVADDADDARNPGSGPQFRAPVRGRVIAGFGPKPGGTHNDGVNFAVPEGTGVRAAEDGVVAYAGNELKGYGNLVLIKHADGYVTAYAHNSELSVKRGDTVRRGQIVAKAGQSGNVTSPQLHFEIRKGSTAVDPSRYVAGL